MCVYTCACMCLDVLCRCDSIHSCVCVCVFCESTGGCALLL